MFLTLSSSGDVFLLTRLWWMRSCVGEQLDTSFIYLAYLITLLLPTTLRVSVYTAYFFTNLNPSWSAFKHGFSLLCMHLHWSANDIPNLTVSANLHLTHIGRYGFWSLASLSITISGQTHHILVRIQTGLVVFMWVISATGSQISY